ncbi:IclR family transcriptional regulator [Pseudorhodoferax sp.]|uniref:IclR family transcriptional regulator n=1 Tax=Pseudorhodoferax sp. TaxID=1993553 RepID=UPI0039E3C4E5
MKAPEPPARTGTQSIERAVHLLRELAARGARGWGLRGLAGHCGLEVATVHRMLKCLVDTGLVQQRASDRRYLLGPLNFELGLCVPNRIGLPEAARQAVRQLARKFSRVTSSVVVRSGDECICIARAGAASFDSQASAIREGHSAPLLSRLSGMAIVAALPPHEAEPLVARSQLRLAHFGGDFLAHARTILQDSRCRGHAFSAGAVLYRVHSLAVAFGPENAPIGSIAVSAWSDDYSADALQAVLPHLQAAAVVLAAHAPQA